MPSGLVCSPLNAPGAALSSGLVPAPARETAVPSSVGSVLKTMTPLSDSTNEGPSSWGRTFDLTCPSSAALVGASYTVGAAGQTAGFPPRRMFPSRRVACPSLHPIRRVLPIFQGIPAPSWVDWGKRMDPPRGT